MRRTGAPCAVIARDIGSTGLSDACLPWPYVDIDEVGINQLASAYPEFVSLSGVVLPNRSMIPESKILVPFKPHYAFDPSLPTRPLSKKSLSNLKSGLRHWEFSQSQSVDDWQHFEGGYRELMQRRNLAGSTFDFPSSHFRNLATLPYVALHGAKGADGWGAMICSARFGAEMHLIHLVVTTSGLLTNASYVMMQGLIDSCRESGIAMFIGGVPAGDEGGIQRFKQRWTNTTRMSFLLRRILRPEVYRKLAIPDNTFFPAYRRDWSL